MKMINLIYSIFRTPRLAYQENGESPNINDLINRWSSSIIHTLVLTICCLMIGFKGYSQNYSSRAPGIWTSASVWTTTSGNGASTPATDGGWGSVNISHAITLNGNYNLAYPLTIGSGGTLTINGNLSGGSFITINGGDLIVNGNFSGGSVINFNGGNLSVTGDFSRSGGGHITIGDNSTLTINQDVILDARLQVNRGGKAIIDGNVTVNSAEYVIVAQNNQTENPSEYADLVIKGDLINSGSGDVSINYHGRLGVYGDLVDSGGGGTFLRLREGSQAYIHGDVKFTGGGGAIRNEENANSPFGLYVNGSIENTNGVTDSNNLKTFTVNGVDITVPCYNQSTCTLPNGTTSNVGSQQVMVDTNEDFAEWVQSELGLSLITPQPVNLLYFKATTQQQSIEINWTSSKAWDFSHYELERSADGKVFEYMATIDAEENSSAVISFSYSDRQPIFGTSYYRLKAVDIDGAFEYKEVAIVNFGAESFKVFPNPTEIGYFNVSWSHAMEGAMLSLRDQAGRTVRITSMSGNIISVSTEGLAPGIYLLSIQSPAGIQQSRVLVK